MSRLYVRKQCGRSFAVRMSAIVGGVAVCACECMSTVTRGVAVVWTWLVQVQEANLLTVVETFDMKQSLCPSNFRVCVCVHEAKLLNVVHALEVRQRRFLY